MSEQRWTMEWCPRCGHQREHTFGDEQHPDTDAYVAANLRAALDLIPDTGDWHGLLRGWCDRNDRGIAPNDGLTADRDRLQGQCDRLADALDDAQAGLEATRRDISRRLKGEAVLDVPFDEDLAQAERRCRELTERALAVLSEYRGSEGTGT